MAAPERRGWEGLLKSSSLGVRGEEEMRGWRHGVNSPQENDSSSWLLIHQTHPRGPRLTLHPAMNNTPCHTPQLDPEHGVCVSQRGGETGAECVACVVVFATCCRIIPWELCVCG